MSKCINEFLKSEFSELSENWNDVNNDTMKKNTNIIFDNWIKKFTDSDDKLKYSYSSNLESFFDYIVEYNYDSSVFVNNNIDEDTEILLQKKFSKINFINNDINKIVSILKTKQNETFYIYIEPYSNLIDKSNNNFIKNIIKLLNDYNNLKIISNESIKFNNIIKELELKDYSNLNKNIFTIINFSNLLNKKINFSYISNLEEINETFELNYFELLIFSKISKKISINELLKLNLTEYDNNYKLVKEKCNNENIKVVESYFLNYVYVNLELNDINFELFDENLSCNLLKFDNNYYLKLNIKEFNESDLNIITKIKEYKLIKDKKILVNFTDNSKSNDSLKNYLIGKNIFLYKSISEVNNINNINNIDYLLIESNKVNLVIKKLIENKIYPKIIIKNISMTILNLNIIYKYISKGVIGFIKTNSESELILNKIRNLLIKEWNWNVKETKNKIICDNNYQQIEINSKNLKDDFDNSIINTNLRFLDDKSNGYYVDMIKIKIEKPIDQYLVNDNFMSIELYDKKYLVTEDYSDDKNKLWLKMKNHYEGIVFLNKSIGLYDQIKYSYEYIYNNKVNQIAHSAFVGGKYLKLKYDIDDETLTYDTFKPDSVIDIYTNEDDTTGITFESPSEIKINEELVDNIKNNVNCLEINKIDDVKCYHLHIDNFIFEMEDNIDNINTIEILLDIIKQYIKTGNIIIFYYDNELDNINCISYSNEYSKIKISIEGCIVSSMYYFDMYENNILEFNKNCIYDNNLLNVKFKSGTFFIETMLKKIDVNLNK